MYSKETLKAAGRDLDFVGGCHKEGNDVFAWLIAGRGEIQVNEDGSAYWLTWDRTHAVSEEVELSPPEVTDGKVLAEWMVQEARRFQDR